jgi:TRAP-type C4-dicarboxylate transport system permease small subunit
MNPSPDPLAAPEPPPPAGEGEGAALRVLYGVLGLVMLIGVALNLANVIGRYVFGSPIFWAEEVLVGITIWGVFVGAAVVCWRGDHLAMDLFSARIGGRARIVLNAVIALSLIVVCGFVAWQSWTIVRLFHETEAVSAGAGIPKVIPHSALLIGFVLSALAVLVRWRVWVLGRAGDKG